MAAKAYYLILGISPAESPSGVRSAFRDLVRQHHPDRAGPSGAPRFREIVEAYRVLSDPDRRREYDAALRQPAASVGDPGHVRRGRRMRARPFDLVDLFGNRESIRPSADWLLDRILSNFGGRGRPKGERPEPLLCDVSLTRDEARRGGVLPIRIPIAVVCASCQGSGHVASFPCPRCDATGAAASERTVPLAFPPGVRSGTIVEAPLDRWGIRNLWLRVRIRVEG